MNDIIYWVWLSQKNGPGHSDAIRLLQYFPGGAREIYEATNEQLLACKDCSMAFIRRLMNRDLKEAERILEFCFINGIRVVSCASENYPKRLRSLYNKPVVLYIRGMIEDLDDRFCVSIVGTRNMSDYGKHMTFSLARQLISYGAVIISGAAYGIDSTANNTAVFMDEPSVAVLGSGVNVPYPAKNKELLDKIAAKGMVISEYEPNTPPYSHNFPLRNRIISGLSDAVVVVECALKSGALITARYAADQGRRVYAVPGNVGAPGSIGPNSLIRDGAKLVMRCEDIIEDFEDRFNLEQLDRIISSEKYLRYEYNHSIPVRNENKPMTRDGVKIVRASATAARKENIGEKHPDEATPRRTQRSPRIVEKQGGPSVTVKHESDISQNAESAADKKEKIYAMTDDNQRLVLDAMPSGTEVTIDQLAKTGLSTNMILSSLTMLELFSAVESLPGGLYKKLI
ncbi:MAG: DNA-processing protein DprA [Clostridia bacterium]|nr:DNA-processing protein DprA [Clostridia bacterium]